MKNKNQIQKFWNNASCGEVYAVGTETNYYESQREVRYKYESYIHEFAKFHEGSGRHVLEIGIGMGADHVEWAKSDPVRLCGIDLTERAVEQTRKRLAIYGLASDIQVADAEHLPFPDASFDIVYSWGVLHHSPDTMQCFREVHRVLKPGGTARIMVYHKFSIVGYMLWLRYAFFSGRPFTSLREIYSSQLESPGTKAYSKTQINRMLSSFSRTKCSVQLSVGDLLEGEAGQRHQGVLLKYARRIWPRWLIRRTFKSQGLFLLVEAVK